MEEALITAQTTVNVTLHQATAWFMALKDHPERYQFETHAGFTFTHGNFGTIDAHFETREHFYGLRFSLHFELTDIKPDQFRFRLQHLPIWGAFELQEQVSVDASAYIHLRLHVGGTTAVGRAIVRSPFVYNAVKRQIQGEADNIKASMESLYSTPSLD
jgi:hypothetical protein